MNVVARNIAITALLIINFSISSFAQNLTGIWRGFFVTDGGDQYKYEFQIKHDKNNIIGVSYSFLDTRFYGKATLEGNFVKADNSAIVRELKTVEVKMAGGSVACIMKCFVSYSKSGKEEFLEGSYTSMYETTNPYLGIKRGADCGGGKLYLRKMPTSEFPLESFLKNEPKKTTPAERRPVVTKPKTPTTTNKPPVVTKPDERKPDVAVKPKPKLENIEPNQKNPLELEIENKPIERKITTTPLTTRSRKNELARTVTIYNEEIEIRLYDNGEIDDDTVSIYLDDKLIIANQRLSKQPIIHKIKLDVNNPEQTLIMIAENLGRIPPNTALMLVQDGNNRHQISITSTEQKNAMVRFRYEKKE
ncbi:MAG TPA: hypothetical protein VM368_02420 [Flavisolibacter sp.]|nr:hypothetical protein [Flavisolibacter sp.]